MIIENELFQFIFLLVLFIGISFVLENFWAKFFKGKKYQLILFPGVVVHELSHAVGCLLTGAKIEEISLFSSKGSYVKHRKPKIPLIGMPVISFAPIIGGIIFLFFSSRFFELSFEKLALLSIFSKESIIELTRELFNYLEGNWESWAFWVFSYLCVSVIICLVPSKQDLKNAASSMIFLVLALLALNYFNFFTKEINSIILYGTEIVLIGVFFGLTALVVSFPVFLIKKFI